jgi:hypothetical protein
VGASLLICGILPLLAVVDTRVFLVFALFTFGIGVGVSDYVSNSLSIVIERESGRPLISGFHGLYSVGGIVGSGGVSALLIAGRSPLFSTLCAAIFIILILSWIFNKICSRPVAREKLRLAMPPPIIFILGALCFIVFLAEGSTLDWSGVYLTSVRGMDPSYSGLGFAAFASMMIAGRLNGDRLVRHVREANIIMLGGLIAGGGLTLTMLTPDRRAWIAGYALVGFGCSNIVPLLYRAIGRQDFPESLAVPIVSTMGYSGVLMGPAAIGLISSLSSLTVAFLVVAVLLVATALVGRIIRI